MAREHTIEVKVEQGKLVYEVSIDHGPKKNGKQARVFFNDKVEWICHGGALACLFQRSPFGKAVRSAEPGELTDKLTVDKKHDPSGNNQYKYFAVVMEASGPTSEDPEIIVDENP